MAGVTATFEADFTKWIKGIQEVNGSLDELRKVTGTTEASVEKMVSRFDGQKVLREATNMVDGIKELGGASKLTEAEAARVNRTISEAIEKMQKLGGVAPPEMLKLRDATARVVPETEKLSSANESLIMQLRNVAGALGIAFGATAIIAGIKSLASTVLESSSHIHDLSVRLGISTDAIQDFQQAAKLSGTSMDTIVSSITIMNTRLAKGSDSTVAALRSAGLEFDDIRAMRPEEAFVTIGQAIANMQDPMLQTRTQTELLGRASAEMLTMFKENSLKAAQEIKNFDKDTVESLDRANKAIEKTGQTLFYWFGTGLHFLIEGIKGLQDPTMRSLEDIKNATIKLLGDVVNQIGPITKELDKSASSTKSLIPAMTSAAEAERLFTASNKAHEEQLKRSRDAQDKYAASVRNLAAQYTGANLAAEVKKISDALVEAGGIAKVTAYEKQQLGKQLVMLQERGATLTPELQKIATEYRNLQIKALPVITTTESIANALGAVKQVALSLPPLAPVMKLPTKDVTAADVEAWQKSLEANMSKAGKAASTALASSFSGNLNAMLTTDLPKNIMAAVTGGGDVIAAAGSTIGSFLVSEKGIGNALTSGAKALFGETLGKSISSMLPGLGAAIGPAVSALFTNLFGSAGRDSVKEFAASFGGFDALREKLNALGAEGERLWVALTQGVGKNNKEQAEAAIKAIKDALQKAEQQSQLLREEIKKVGDELADLKSRSEPSFQDMQAAAEKFGVEMSKLGPLFQQQRLTERAREIYDAFDTLKRGGADTAVILEGMKDEIADLVKQSLQFGTTIPENFRPFVQQLIESGELVDENGEKLTDFGKIKFGDAVKSQWEVIADRIKDLTEALRLLVEKLGGVAEKTQAVAREFENIPRNVDVKLNVIRNNGLINEDELPGFATGTKGVTGKYFQNFGAGSLAMLHGNEAVVPASQADEFADSINGGNGGVVAELSGLRSDFAAMPRIIARAVRDAILVAG